MNKKVATVVIASAFIIGKNWARVKKVYEATLKPHIDAGFEMAKASVNDVKNKVPGMEDPITTEQPTGSSSDEAPTSSNPERQTEPKETN